MNFIHLLFKSLSIISIIINTRFANIRFQGKYGQIALILKEALIFIVLIRLKSKISLTKESLGRLILLLTVLFATSILITRARGNVCLVCPAARLAVLARPVIIAMDFSLFRRDTAHAVAGVGMRMILIRCHALQQQTLLQL